MIQHSSSVQMAAWEVPLGIALTVLGGMALAVQAGTNASLGSHITKPVAGVLWLRCLPSPQLPFTYRAPDKPACFPLSCCSHHIICAGAGHLCRLPPGRCHRHQQAAADRS